MAEALKQRMEASDEEVESFSEESEESDFDKEYTCDLCKTSFSGLKPLRQHERSGKHLKALRRQKLNKEIDEDLKNLNLDDDSGDEDFTIKKVVAKCDICDKVFNGPESYRQHIKSKNHKRKMKEMKLLEMAKEDGKVNMEKLKKLLQAGNVPSTGEARTETVDSDEDVYKCEDCQKVFTGLIPLRDHLVSKSHKNTLKENILKEKLVAAVSDEENGVEIDEDFLVCKTCKMSFSGPSNVIAHLKGKNHSNMVEFLEWKKEKKRLRKEQEKKSVSPEVVPRGSDSEQKVDKKTSEKDEFSSPNEVTENLNASKSESDQEKERRENTWKTYESYKNYKKVMNDSKSEI